MKHTISTIAAVLLLAVVFTGCKKDDDDPKPSAIHIGDTVVTIAGGSLINYGATPSQYDGYNLALRLYDESITITETSPGVRSIDGDGFLFYCEMFSSSEAVLADGVYTYSASIPSPEGTYDYGEYYFKYETGYWYEFTTGTLKVTKSGNNYEIIIALTDQHNTVINGYYNGPLDYFGDNSPMVKK
jgi:hypothetical protein